MNRTPLEASERDALIRTLGNLALRHHDDGLRGLELGMAIDNYLMLARQRGPASAAAEGTTSVELGREDSDLQNVLISTMYDSVEYLSQGQYLGRRDGLEEPVVLSHDEAVAWYNARRRSHMPTPGLDSSPSGDYTHLNYPLEQRYLRIERNTDNNAAGFMAWPADGSSPHPISLPEVQQWYDRRHSLNYDSPGLSERPGNSGWVEVDSIDPAGSNLDGGLTGAGYNWERLPKKSVGDFFREKRLSPSQTEDFVTQNCLLTLKSFAEIEQKFCYSTQSGVLRIGELDVYREFFSRQRRFSDPANMSGGELNPASFVLLRN